MPRDKGEKSEKLTPYQFSNSLKYHAERPNFIKDIMNQASRKEDIQKSQKRERIQTVKNYTDDQDDEAPLFVTEDGEIIDQEEIVGLLEKEGIDDYEDDKKHELEKQNEGIGINRKKGNR
jgi:hypothetical protein